MYLYLFQKLLNYYVTLTLSFTFMLAEMYCLSQKYNNILLSPIKIVPLTIFHLHQTSLLLYFTVETQK